MLIPFIRLFLPAFLLLGFLPGSLAQTRYSDLSADLSFFQQKRQEYNAWLRKNGFAEIFTADKVAVNGQKVTLYLRPPTETPHSCAAIQDAWARLESNHTGLNGQFFHEQLLNKWAFLAEVHNDQAEIIVRCHEPPHFHARVYHENGHTPVEGTSVRSAPVVEMRVPATYSGITAGDNAVIISGQKLQVVTERSRQYLSKWYSSKGTPILWKARIAQPYVAVDEFILEVTHLSHEIVPDGFFEYHRIYVKGEQRGTDVRVTWEFQGKYGSGILFPPRRNDYKDTETHYKDSLEEYQEHLFKQLISYLRQ